VLGNRLAARLVGLVWADLLSHPAQAKGDEADHQEREAEGEERGESCPIERKSRARPVQGAHRPSFGLHSEGAERALRPSAPPSSQAPKELLSGLPISGRHPPEPPPLQPLALPLQPAAFLAALLPLKQPLRRRNLYQTRHTFASNALAAGEALSWVAAMLGHTTPEMLFQVYTRYIPNRTRRDGSALAGRMAPSTSVAPAGSAPAPEATPSEPACTPDLLPSPPSEIPEAWKIARLAKGRCERGDLNPTTGRENPALSRTATVKDRRRPSRIVPDRHNLAGAAVLRSKAVTHLKWSQARPGRKEKMTNMTFGRPPRVVTSETRKRLIRSGLSRVELVRHHARPDEGGAQDEPPQE
jgi:hypothetical protein